MNSTFLWPGFKPANTNHQYVNPPHKDGTGSDGFSLNNGTVQEEEHPSFTAHRDVVNVRTVNQGRDGSLVVRVGEENQLFVDEVIVGEVPGLSSIQVLLRKRIVEKYF